MMAEDTKSKSFVEPGVLYVVPTPIGNMADVTERARIVLAGVDLIAAEDTRNTGRLLALLGLKKPCVAYHEHNARASGVHILAALKAGKSCALVTDAGTPAVSDPGEQLVADCAREGVRVVPLPGACAAVCALSGAGLPSRRFAFEGFLPTKRASASAILPVCAAIRIRSFSISRRTMRSAIWPTCIGRSATVAPSSAAS